MNGLATLLRKFDERTLRERAILAIGSLALAILAWDSVLMQPLRNTRSALSLELASTDGADPASAEDDPHRMALQQATDLQTQLRAIDEQLATSAQGFVPASRMTEVVQDVLSRQKGLALVSIRNLPMKSLVEPTEADTAAATSGEGAPATAPAATDGGPYVHPIELIIDGTYGDVLTYLRALEALPWKLRWTILELSAKDYPMNRVHIEVSTLGMDPAWLGVGK